MTATATATADTPASGARLGSIEPAPPFRDRSAFADQVAGLKSGRGALRLNQRLLMLVGGALAPLGIVLVLLGWRGAATTPNLFEQIPYLISGGLLGLGLTFLGGFLYFAHWLTELVKESRSQSAAVVDAVERLRQDLAMRDAAIPTTVGQPAPAAASTPAGVPVESSVEPPTDLPAEPPVGPAAGTTRNGRKPLVAVPVALLEADDADVDASAFVATARGSMAHEATCVVVAGKSDLRTVTSADGLKACKLCEPY